MVEVDTGGASFQNQTIERRQNPNYGEQLKTYNESRVYEIAELRDLKEKMDEKLKGTTTNRKTAVDNILISLRGTKDTNEFFNKFITEYQSLLKSSYAQPSIFGGGSRLAKAMRDFARQFLFIELSPKLHDKRANYKVTEPVLHTIAIGKPAPTQKLDN